MKSKTLLYTSLTSLVIMLGISIITSGCKTIDVVVDLYNDINKPDPTPDEPTIPDEPAKPDEKVQIYIDYTKPWALTLTGDFSANEHQRFIQNGTVRDGLDLFRWAGTFALRLYDRRIIFTEAINGSISMPEPPDHWAMSIPQRGTAKWTGTIKIVYDPNGNCTLYRNNELIGQWKFKTVQNPPVRRELWLRGFKGTVNVTY